MQSTSSQKRGKEKVQSRHIVLEATCAALQQQSSRTKKTERSVVVHSNRGCSERELAVVERGYVTLGGSNRIWQQSWLQSYMLQW